MPCVTLGTIKTDDDDDDDDDDEVQCKLHTFHSHFCQGE